MLAGGAGGLCCGPIAPLSGLAAFPGISPGTRSLRGLTSWRSCAKEAPLELALGVVQPHPRADSRVYASTGSAGLAAGMRGAGGARRRHRRPPACGPASRCRVSAADLAASSAAPGPPPHACAALRYAALPCAALRSWSASDGAGVARGPRTYIRRQLHRHLGAAPVQYEERNVICQLRDSDASRLWAGGQAAERQRRQPARPARPKLRVHGSARRAAA